MENKVETKSPKKRTKKKKEGKIGKVFRLFQEGKTVKEIAEETGLKEQVIRSYIWRKQNPQKYQELLRRYFQNKKAKVQEK